MASAFETLGDNVKDFGKEFAQTAVANPWNGLVQLADKVPGVKLPEMHMQGADNKDSIGARAGAMGGFVADFALLSLASKAALKPVFGATGIAERGALGTALSMGTAGGLYGGVFTPSQGDIFSSRLKQAGIQAGTFATMGAVSGALGGGFEGTLSSRVGINALGGGVGGATNALLTERLMNNRWATGNEIASSAGNFALFGAAFAGADYAIGRGITAFHEARGSERYPASMTESLTPFKRLSDEPILAPREGKFDSAGAFNPTATRLPNGDVAILYRAQDNNGVSSVGYARTGPDGVNVVQRSDEPILKARVENEKLGIEDPRLTADPVKPDGWELTATKWDGKDAQLADWTSSDLQNWQERGIMMPANEGTWNTQWTKSGSLVTEEVDGKLVPAKINGKYWMYYMGNREGIDQMGVASSADGVHWTDATEQPILPGRPGQFDSNVVEPGPAAVVTNDGINLIYNGGMPYEGGNGMYKYQAGVAVFSKEDPTQPIYRSNKPLFSPETPWEKYNSSNTVHQVPNVVFAQGLVPDGQGGYNVYYGAADSYVGVAHTRFEAVNRYLGLGNTLGRSFVQSPAVLTPDKGEQK